MNIRSAHARSLLRRFGLGSTVVGFRDDLRRYEKFYNDTRPHQSLGYLTPTEFLAALTAAKLQEDLSRMS